MPGEKFDLQTVVKEQIMQLIAGMNLAKNNRLMSENQLANKLQVSRSTIRTVLATLEDEGKLFRRHGSGTYVNARAFGVNTTLYPQMYYTDLIRQSGYTPDIQLVDFCVRAAGADGEALNISPKSKVAEVRKTYTASGRMCIFCIDLISCDRLTSEQVKQMQTQSVSIFTFLAQYTNMQIVWDVVRLEAVDSHSVAHLLPYLPKGTPAHKPFLMVENLHYNTKDQPILLSQSYVDTDIIQYHLVRGTFGREGQAGQ